MEDIYALVDERRRNAGLSWSSLAEQVGGPPVHTLSALMGNNPLSDDEAARAGHALGLDDAQIAQLTEVPAQRIGRTLEVPADPTLYRLHEAIAMYGPALRALIHDEFGDGIMSAINFRVDLRRETHPDGDRVAITLNGKFLDYRWETETA